MATRRLLDPTLVTFGRNVRRYRELLDFSQETLGEKADLDQTYISGIECGKRNPGIKNVARIAKALDVKTSELCEGVEA
jgi:transcriptional regulator with XRE-family HTH domain